MNSYDIEKVSYRWLRRAIGVLGIILPLALSWGCRQSAGLCTPAASISGYYHTSMRFLFVTVMVLLAVLLFAYPGYDEDDDFAGHLAGLFALGVAIFPTNAPGTQMDLRAWVHVGCAAALFLLMAVFCLFLFRRTEQDRKPPGRERTLLAGARGLLKPPKPAPTLDGRKKMRNRLFVLCGAIILASVAAMLIYEVAKRNATTDQSSDFVWYCETAALVAFGFAWMMKGDMIIAGGASDEPRPE